MAISPTMGVKTTYASQQALKQAKYYGLRLTSAYRSPSHDKEVGGTGSGPHTRGTSYDFAGSRAGMEKFASWAHGSGLFSQVIFNDKDYRTGRRIAGHQDHVHVGWSADGRKAEQEKEIDDRPVFEGSKRSLVYAIQAMLATMFYDIKVDGYFGPKTTKAVKEFQETAKLKVDGIVGKNTWGALTGVFFSE
jgi:peptidoglycan hydrolase-like protein with peptidoglycan-binding domain